MCCMKRSIALTLALGCILFILAGCGQKDAVKTVVPLALLPAAYSLQNAKSDHCVVFEDLDITDGQSEWDAFVKSARAGKTAAVRLAFYYTLLDKIHYSQELYDEIKNDYPILNIQDLYFDGTKYTLKWIEDSEHISKEYSYLVKYEGKPTSKSATFSDYVYYVLVNDDSVTWDELEFGLASSQLGDYIDFYKVYSDLTFK